MGRGSGEQRTLASQQLDIYNQFLQEQRGERQEGRRTLMPMAEALAREGDVSPDEERAIMESGEAGYESGAEAIKNRMVRTRNTAGGAANLRELSRERARLKSDAAGDIGRERRLGKRAGLQLMANLYGIDTNLLSNVAGLPVGALGAHAQGIAGTNVGLGPFSFGRS